MNYIKQINAFYNQIELNPLSASAVALWHTLVHINNKTGWKDTFTVAGMVLRIKSGLKESAFKRARDELKTKGYMTWTSNGSNKAPSYHIVCLSTAVERFMGESAT
ncbi:hypothetical protein SAMN05216238_103118 [Lentibacillus persicus]|uniref:Helix-turn-helix domain-containing protein n=1 Tax=Lentibacillus persicus TaxID=640948 RepID=A0A1I1UAJ0_9BACI|nr:hypothetical protein [Lentibacillus persicus]SFD67881.1 hypothetical protein SAMN05216238_103118 [Lentibacillus persicus]